MGERKLSQGAIVLDRILTEGGPMAAKLCKVFHRTILSRARYGHRKVSNPTAARMSQITGGRLAPEMWEMPARTARPVGKRSGARAASTPTLKSF